METSTHQVTLLLQAWSEGEPGALDQLTPIVYNELHRLARRYMSKERSGHTLQATALVNEAYLRLVDSVHADWRNRAHFFGICARVMRRILVDWARTHQAAKRGGFIRPLELDEGLLADPAGGAGLVALNDALQALSEIDSRKGRVVELRFFGGLDVAETAEVLRISPETVMRDWKFAKSWLRRELSKGGGDGF